MPCCRVHFSMCSENHEELRTLHWKRLEVEANNDRLMQIEDKKRRKEEEKKIDNVYVELANRDMEMKEKREEEEARERNHAFHVQVQVLLEQLATPENSKAAKKERIAEEAKSLVCLMSEKVQVQYCNSFANCFVVYKQVVN